MMKSIWMLSLLTLSLHSALGVEKPNVVFLLVDDFSAGALTSGGSNLHETPNIDSLYKEGMSFKNAYAACTVCSPSRAAILTGKYPARLHLTDWIPGHKQLNEKLLVPQWKMIMDHEETTLYQWRGQVDAQMPTPNPKYDPAKNKGKTKM